MIENSNPQRSLELKVNENGYIQIYRNETNKIKWKILENENY